jgi:biotin carboxylase
LVDSIEQIDRIKDELPLPCFIKPKQGHSSIGSILCRDRDEITKSIAKLRTISSEGISSSYVVEDYLDGPLVSVEILTLEQGVHQVLGVSDRDVVASSIEVGSSFPLKAKAYEAAVSLATRALDAIGYTFGPSHIELIMTEHGPHLVEVNTRVGGSGHSVMLDASLGRSVTGDCVELCLGNHNLDINLYQSQQGAAWQCYASEKPGFIKALPPVEELLALPGVKEAWYHKELGEQLGELDSNFNWVIQVLCVGRDAQDAKAKAKEALRIASAQIAVDG